MTRRLLALARHHWATFDGWAASRNVEPWDLRPDRFFSFIYYWATREATEESLSKFDRRLWMPPKGVAPAEGSPWSPEAETAAFGSLVAEVGQKARQGKEINGPKG